MIADGHPKQKSKPPSRPKNHDKKCHHELLEQVLSPHNCTFVPRRTVQRTPRKLCTLALPQPLSSLFDDPTTETSNPAHHHKRAPSDLNSTAVSVDPSQITESSHPIPSRYHSGASVVSPDIAPHLRTGISCDPLIAFGFVLVPTTDGRIAVYQLMDYGLEVDEDVMASGYRRRSEWEEEDTEQFNLVEKDEKKLIDESSGNDNEEDNVIERMTRRELSRDCVDPLVVISLPIQHACGANSDENESHNYLYSNTVQPMIVSMCATPRGESVIPIHGTGKSQSHIGHVAVVMNDGCVHIIEFTERDPTIAFETKKTYDVVQCCTLIVNIICSFQTNCLGATSICMQPLFQTSSAHIDDSCNENPNKYISEIRLCIGHECGILECYQLNPLISQCEPDTKKSLSSPCSLTKSNSNEIPSSISKNSLKYDSSKHNSTFDNVFDDNDDVTTKLFRNNSEPTENLGPVTPASEEKNNYNDLVETTPLQPINAELLWRGGTNVPIRSLSCPGWSACLADSNAQLIAIGLMQRYSLESRVYEADRMRLRSNNGLSPAISLDVIDTVIAQEHWMRARQEAKIDELLENRSLTIPLSACSVWPAAGMDLKDDRGRHQHSSENLGVKSISVTNKMCQFVGPDPCFAFAASDGTVAISHLNADGSWGIRQNFNQIKLPQRCIGLGAIEGPISGKNGRLVCCCLRGGTIFIVPVTEHIGNSSQITQEIMMLVAPVDSSGSEDGIIRYVQSFGSGMVHVNDWEARSKIHNTNTFDKTTSKAMFFIGWSGGTVDAYDIYPTESDQDEVFFEQLTCKDLVIRLIEKLLLVNRDDPLISSSLWRKAWDECNKQKDLRIIMKGIKNRLTDDFTSTRALLMSLIE